MIEVHRGDSPVVLGLPHTGTSVRQDILEQLNDGGRTLADTDWHVHELYDGLLDSVTTVRTSIHRYVIDANRDPRGVSLYPGANTTTLCPTTDFNGAPIYRDGQEPDDAEIVRRRALFHVPYHAALQAELERVRGNHGHAVLYDCHSIRSRIPFLFEGKLPDFSIGTYDGATCDPIIETAVVKLCEGADGYSTILNGRFKGGWTTRHYGRPAEGLHAIQMELAQSSYMQESPPWIYCEDKATRLRLHLETILASLSEWRPR